MVSDTGKTPTTNNGKTKVKAGKKDLGSIMSHFHKEASVFTELEKTHKAQDEERTKRKIEAMNLDKSRFDFEQKRAEEDQKHRVEVMELQKAQLEHQMKMDNERIRLEDERNKTAVAVEQERAKTTKMMMDMMERLINKDK